MLKLKKYLMNCSKFYIISTFKITFSLYSHVEKKDPLLIQRFYQDVIRRYDKKKCLAYYEKHLSAIETV